MAKHDSPVPLHVEIREYICRNIQPHVFDVNERIPSERSLAEQFGVNHRVEYVRSSSRGERYKFYTMLRQME